MVQHYVYLENFSLLSLPPCLTKRNCQVSRLCQLSPMCSFDTMLCANPCNPPYDGPYPVVKSTDKHFTVDIDGPMTP